MLRVESWKAKFVEAEARDLIVAAEIEEPPERVKPVPPAKSSSMKKAVKAEKKEKAPSTAESSSKAEAASAPETETGAA
eukprot:3918460-Alexandrium_andersonii.AAC.1